MRSSLTLLLAASLLGVVSLPGGGVWASAKSAIAPPVLESELPSPETPAVEPASPPVVNLEAPIAPESVVREPIVKEPVVKAPAKAPVAPVVAAPQVVIVTPKAPEIILESRSSGCRARGNELGQHRADLCPREPDFASYRRGQEPPVRIRTLNAQEIRQLSVPSRGDRQMVFPLNIPALVSSPFGDRWHPIHGGIRFHQGTDLAAPEGTPVVAAFSGRVEVAAWVGGYGLMVVLRHNDRYETRYAHLAELFVAEGQEISQGTVLGLVGSTGNSTGPHLHFELWEQVEGTWYVLDPTPHLLLAMERLEQYLAQLVQPVRSQPEA